MSEKPISEQIIDEFVEKVAEKKILSQKKLESLKSVLLSEDIDKGQIEKVLKEEDADENPGTED